MPFESIPPTDRATNSRKLKTDTGAKNAPASSTRQSKRAMASVEPPALPPWSDVDPDEDMAPTVKMYAKGRAPSKRRETHLARRTMGRTR